VKTTVRKPLLSWKDNYLRAVEFRDPEYIPCRIGALWPLWNTHREKMESIALKHPLVFPGFKPGNIKYGEKTGILRSNKVITDPLGCVWSFLIEGFQGQVVKHPLEDWKSMKGFKLPDPEKGIPVEGVDRLTPWETILEALDKARSSGELVTAGMPHGFFFQRLYYLRGYTKLLRDFMAKPPEIYALVEALTEYNLKLLELFLNSGRLDVVSFGDDLGTQQRMPISPKTFREFIFPSYHRIFQMARLKGVHVRLHSDGHVIEVAGQLIEAGVDILNIQDRVNGLETIGSACKNVACVDLDVDRQYVTAFGNPESIRKHVRRVVEALSMKEGGLMMVAELHPPIPLENIEAVAQAMEEHMWLT